MKPPLFYRHFDYQKTLLPNLHLASLEEGVRSIEDAKKNTGYSLGYPGWGLIYYMLLSHLNRQKYEIIVETGTNWGCTTIILAQALIDSGCAGRVITFELDVDNAKKAKENFDAAGVSDRVEMHVGNSLHLMPEVLEKEGAIRVALLDASHMFDDVMKEFDIVFPRLANDALLVFDNTYRIAEEHEDQRVNGALKTIQKLHGGNLINFEFVSWYTPGLAIWQRNPIL